MLVSMIAQAAAATLTLAEARAMSPAQLADAMLEPGHPPIRGAIVHPIGMEAPSASLQAVTLIGVPGPAPERGWCRQTDWRITLKPIDPTVNGYTTATTTRVSAREPWDRYRLATGRCDDPKATFFTLRANGKQAQFALIERVRAASRLAAGRRALPFALTCRDQDGARASVFGGDRCGADGGRTLLARLPIDRMYDVSVAGTSTVLSISRNGASATRTEPRPASLGLYDDALVIDAEVQAGADGTITGIALKRHIPYPF